MNRLKLFVITLIFPFVLSAQGLEAGLFMGVTNYQGDLAEEIMELEETKLAVGLFLRYHIDDLISIRSSFYTGTLSGDDKNATDPGRINRELRFKSRIYEVSFSGELNILGNPAVNYLNEKDRLIYPFVAGGIGINYVEPRVIQGEGTLDPEKADYQNLSLVIPISAGVKMKINDIATFGLELGFRTVLNDYLDGVSKLANPNKNDWYAIAGLNISVLLGQNY